MSQDDHVKPSKGQIDRAGKTLRDAKPGTAEYEAAMDVVNIWRRQHALPMAAMKAILKSRTRTTKSALIAQRLKRSPTIADKLNRQPDMRLSRMQDVGGLRVILRTTEEVEALAAKLRSKRIKHELVRERNYIDQPKPDGYRGIHMVFKYRGTNKDGSKHPCDGLAIEVQLRTKLQHTWGTAVESAGIIRGEAYKSDKGSKGWLEFFALTSSVMAYSEEKPLLADHQGMSPRDLIKQVAAKEKQLDVLKQIRGMSIAANYIHKNNVSTHYNLIVLEPATKNVTIYGFAANQLEDATNKYAEAEKRAAKGEIIEPVLVSAGRLKSLKSAYPNYFLDLSNFVEAMEKIIKLANE